MGGVQGVWHVHVYESNETVVLGDEHGAADLALGASFVVGIGDVDLDAFRAQMRTLQLLQATIRLPMLLMLPRTLLWKRRLRPPLFFLFVSNLT